MRDITLVALSIVVSMLVFAQVSEVRAAVFQTGAPPYYYYNNAQSSPSGWAPEWYDISWCQDLIICIPVGYGIHDQFGYVDTGGEGRLYAKSVKTSNPSGYSVDTDSSALWDDNPITITAPSEYIQPGVVIEGLTRFYAYGYLTPPSGTNLYSAFVPTIKTYWKWDQSTPFQYCGSFKTFFDNSHYQGWTNLGEWVILYRWTVQYNPWSAVCNYGGLYATGGMHVLASVSAYAETGTAVTDFGHVTPGSSGDMGYLHQTWMGLNIPPSTPTTPSGPTSGSNGVTYTYTASATDPDDSWVGYIFNWGDGTTTTVWSNTPGSTFASTVASASHTWANPGTYYVSVQAYNQFGCFTTVAGWQCFNSYGGWSNNLAVQITGPSGGGGGGGGSIAYGSLVTLANGSLVPVQNLNAGDTMLGYNTQTGQFTTSILTRIWSVNTTNMMIITTQNGVPFRVDANPHQTLWTKLSNGTILWLPVTQIQVGYSLFTPNGWTQVTGIQFAPSGNHVMFDMVATMPYFADGYLDPILKM